VTKQVSKRRLLALTTGSGRVVYPAFQFTAQRGAGLPGVVATSTTLVSPWTVASWLVSPASVSPPDRGAGRR
jgi:hypothetical protein